MDRIEVQAMAHDMGDDFGDDADTVLIISRVMDLPVEFVVAALQEPTVDITAQ